MSGALLDLLRTARGAGMRISSAEAIDALQAAEAVGYDDRTTLRDALRLTLAKTQDDAVLFDDSFDAFFRREAPRKAEALDPASTAVAIEAAGQAVGLGDISLFTQTGLFTRRIMQALGDATYEEAPELAAQVRAHVEARLALNAPAQAREFRERRLLTTRIGAIERRDLAQLRVMVRMLAKRLATRLTRRRKRAQRGQLDLRRTLRRNFGHDGVPFRLAWKHRPIAKPRLFAVCDVSGSVAGVSRLLLTFLHVLADLLPDTRCFAFAGELVEVSDLMAAGEPDQAIGAVLDRIGHQSTNYGRSLEDFATLCLDRVDRRSTVIILGDARGNYAPPRVDLLRRVQQRARQVIWLNPEFPTFWGSGDSDMLLYRPFCARVLSCGTLRQLDRALSEILP